MLGFVGGRLDREKVVGQQDTLAPSMPLWHKDCFELKIIEKKQMQKKKKAPCPLSVCLEVGHQFAKMSPSPLNQEGRKLITRDARP